MRVPIIRRAVDGTITDGTAEARQAGERLHVCDFRDLDGAPLSLPPGALFEILCDDGARYYKAAR